MWRKILSFMILGAGLSIFAFGWGMLHPTVSKLSLGQEKSFAVQFASRSFRWHNYEDGNPKKKYCEAEKTKSKSFDYDMCRIYGSEKSLSIVELKKNGCDIDLSCLDYQNSHYLIHGSIVGSSEFSSLFADCARMIADFQFETPMAQHKSFDALKKYIITTWDAVSFYNSCVSPVASATGEWKYLFSLAPDVEKCIFAGVKFQHQVPEGESYADFLKFKIYWTDTLHENAEEWNKCFSPLYETDGTTFYHYEIDPFPTNEECNRRKELVDQKKLPFIEISQCSF